MSENETTNDPNQAVLVAAGAAVAFAAMAAKRFFDNWHAQVVGFEDQKVFTFKKKY